MDLCLLDGTISIRTASAQFEFSTSIQERNDILWYLEKYLKFPFDPSPVLARRIEETISEEGKALFDLVFSGNRECKKLWERVAGALHKTRIEIITQVHDASSLPWEFIRDRKTGRWLVLAAKAFSHRTERESSVILEERDVPLRILLVISRPGLERDVPFQSVARQVVQGLWMERTTGDAIELTVLRPSTFKAFCTALHSARAQGTPYHLIHFGASGFPVGRVKE